MVERSQTIYATFEERPDGTSVTVMADDWTPDYMGLTDAVGRRIDLDALADTTDPTRRKSMRLGEATFDDDAESLGADDITLDLEESVLSEWGR